MRIPDGNYRLLAISIAFLSVFFLVTGTSWAVDRFVDNLNGTVTDTKTALMWQQTDDGTLRSWADAPTYCENLVLGGHNDWRLPRIDELQTILDYSQYYPAIDPLFVSTITSIYWSSNSYPAVEQAWVAGFGGGGVGSQQKAFAAYVRCVRNGPFWDFNTSSHLQASSANTVQDTYWGYMWQKGDSGTFYAWEQAKSYCNDLSLDGFTDWRLPEMDVLQTITDYTTYDPALSQYFDPRMAQYWSSTTSVGYFYPDYAWAVDTHDGSTNVIIKTNPYPYFVRCVREAPGSFVTLNLAKSGTGTGRVTSDPAGIDCETDCNVQSTYFPEGTVIVLTAEPDYTSVFQGWSGGGCSGVGECVVTIGGASVAVTATFSIKPIRIYGSGYNYPGGNRNKATFYMDITNTPRPAGWLKYLPPGSQRLPYRMDMMGFESTSISAVSVRGNIVTIAGAGKMNGLPGYTFTATVTTDSPVRFGITFEYHADLMSVQGGKLVISY